MTLREVTVAPVSIVKDEAARVRHRLARITHRLARITHRIRWVASDIFGLQ